MLANEGQRLVEIVKGYNESIMTPLSEDNIKESLENLDELREYLSDIDLMLAQAANILKGYEDREQKTEPEEASTQMASNIKQRLEHTEKFNSFLDKIADQEIVVGDPDHDEE
jgi:biopolymer transport protein ExbB/TolQ